VEGLNQIKKDIKEKKLKGSYVLFGHDEGIIKSYVEEIKASVLSGAFSDLNFTEFDGRKLESIDDVINACETLPLLSPYRIVLVYRATFLESNEDPKEKKIVDSLLKYIPEMSDQTILIIYSVLYSKRDKPSSKIKRFEKVCKVIEAKYDSKEKKSVVSGFIKDIINASGKSINKVELEILFELYKNSDSMLIKNELDKLLSFAEGDMVSKEHIRAICTKSSDDDIFDLVDNISNKKFSQTLDIMNDLFYKGEKPEGIIFFIERQLRLLLFIKYGINENKSVEYISKSLNLNAYVCKNMMNQSNGFTIPQLMKSLEICLDSEKKFKSESIDKSAELELLIINLMSII